MLASNSVFSVITNPTIITDTTSTVLEFGSHFHK